MSKKEMKRKIEQLEARINALEELLSTQPSEQPSVVTGDNGLYNAFLFRPIGATAQNSLIQAVGTHTVSTDFTGGLK